MAALTPLRARACASLSGRMIEIGENIGPGAPLFTLVQPANAWFTFNIREDQLHGVAVGDTLNVTIPALDTTVEAKVTLINVQGDFASWRATRATGGRSLRGGEPAGPADLLGRGEGQLQEAQGLQLVCARERAGVDGGQAAGLHRVDERGLGGRVVAGDEHRRRLAADRARRERRGEVGVERLEHLRLGQALLQARGGGAAHGHDERVEGREVEGVGDVDDGLAGELVAVGVGDRGERRIGHGEHDDVAGDPGVGVRAADVLDVGAAAREDAGDGLTHVAGAEDGDGGHGESFPSRCCICNYPRQPRCADKYS